MTIRCFLFRTVAFVLTPLTFAAAQTIIDRSRTAAAVEGAGADQSVLQSQSADTFRILHEENTFAPTSPGDNDIGQQLILKSNEHNYPWRLSVDNSAFWTDNVANLNKVRLDDWFWVGGATVNYQPRLLPKLFLDFNIAEHWYEYDKYSLLNFQSGEASAGVIALMPELFNTIWYVNYYYQRITQGLGDKPIYSTQNIRAGMQRTFLIDRLNSFNFGLQGSFSMAASPDELRRNEYTVMSGYNLKIMRELVFSLNYRLTCYDYHDFDGRRDWYNNMGAALTWSPRNWCDISASYNYTKNNSNKPAFEYHSQLAGPSLTLKAKF